MLNRRRSLATLAVVFLSLLTGCSADRFVGVRYLENDSLEFFVPLCGDERLREVWLEDLSSVEGVGDGDVLWRIQTDGTGAAIPNLHYGDTPSDFATVELTPLDGLAQNFSNRRLRVNARTDRASRLTGAFTLDELPTDGSAVVFTDGDDKTLSVDQPVAHHQDQCSPSSPSRRAVAAVPVLLLAAVPLGWWVFRRRNRQRTESRELDSPE